MVQSRVPIQAPGLKAWGFKIDGFATELTMELGFFEQAPPASQVHVEPILVS